jgi:hypothetical protein
MGPFQICGCFFCEPGVCEIAQIVVIYHFFFFWGYETSMFVVFFLQDLVLIWPVVTRVWPSIVLTSGKELLNSSFKCWPRLLRCKRHLVAKLVGLLGLPGCWLMTYPFWKPGSRKPPKKGKHPWQTWHSHRSRNIHGIHWNPRLNAIISCRILDHWSHPTGCHVAAGHQMDYRLGCWPSRRSVALDQAGRNGEIVVYT